MSPAIVTLISSDGCTFDIPMKSAILSTLIVDTLNLDEMDNDDTNDNDNDGADDHDTTTGSICTTTKKLEVDCLNVNRITLERITRFLLHYPDNPFVSTGSTNNTGTSSNTTTSTLLSPLPILKKTFEECVVPDNDNFYQNFINEINNSSTNTLTTTDTNTNTSVITISDDIYTLKHAANYMNIPVLYDLICIFQRCQIERCKSTEEIMNILRIPAFPTNDDGTSSAEEESYRIECPWMFRFHHINNN